MLLNTEPDKGSGVRVMGIFEADDQSFVCCGDPLEGFQIAAVSGVFKALRRYPACPHGAGAVGQVAPLPVELE